MENLQLKQLELEKNDYNDSITKYKNNLAKFQSNGQFSDTKEMKTLQKLSIDDISKSIRLYITGHDKIKNSTQYRIILSEFLDKTDELALITIRTIINNIAKVGKIGESSLSNKIGREIYNYKNIIQLEKTEPKIVNFIKKEFRKKGQLYINQRLKGLTKIKGLDSNDVNNDIFKIGSILLYIVLNNSDLFTKLKETVKVGKKFKTSNIIKMSKEAYDITMSVMQDNILNFQQYRPLIIPPKEWNGINGTGGYYTPGINIPLLKRNKKVATYSEMIRYIDIINKIQKTKFTINNEILDIVNHIIKNNIKGSTNKKLMLGLPSMENIKYKELKDYGEIDKTTGKLIDTKNYKRYYREKEEINDENQSLIGKRISTMMTIDIAEKYKKYEDIYFTYQADSRGRIYPIQQILNPQSAEIGKSLLSFSNYKNISEEESKWLIINIANNFGNDKMLFDKRIEWFYKNYNLIKEEALNPLDNLKTINEADSPLLYLQSILDYFKNYEVNGISNCPIAIDATCSGIQIYSMLLKDYDGAKAVNVIYDGSYEDIYQEVADKVNNYLNNGDYNKNFEVNKSDGIKDIINVEELVESIKGKINRKLTKRNTMTIPYSVSRFGMRKQIEEVLIEIEDNNDKFWVGENWVFAKFLTELNYRAISEIVKGARDGQDFIINVTRECSILNKPLFYKTPILNFPVLQSEFNMKERRINTPSGKLSLLERTNVINGRSQGSAAAPNLIHSLDSTLMLLSVEKTDTLDFALVHDSFAVHACHIEELRENIKISMIEMFKDGNILEDWKNQVLPECDITVPMINNLDINDINDSVYYFN